MWRRTYDAWGYSPLDQINRENVGKLQLAWSRGMAPGRQQATPLVYQGIMFLPEPGDVITALDAVSGDLLWEYRRELPEDIRQLVSGESTRNIAIYKDSIYHSTWDAHVVAINIKTGAQVWQTKVRDYRDGIMHSSVRTHRCGRRRGVSPDLLPNDDGQRPQAARRLFHCWT